MQRVLIVGCGYVGTALGRLLARTGYEVFGARRAPEHLPPEISPIPADVTSADGLERIPSDLDHVFYMPTPAQSDDTSYERVYVTGLANTIAKLRRGSPGVRRLCFISSTAVFGQDDGSLVDERSPTRPQSFRGRRMLAAEALVLAAPYEGVVARSSGIYGPGRTRLIDRVRDGRETVSPDTDRYTNRIHRDDLAGALAHLIRIDGPAPVYILSDSEPALKSEVVAWIAGQLRVPLHPPSRGAEPRGGNKRCSNALLRTSGYTFRYPSYREGYGELLATGLLS